MSSYADDIVMHDILIFYFEYIHSIYMNKCTLNKYFTIMMKYYYYDIYIYIYIYIYIL